MSQKHPRHHFHSAWKRAVASLILVGSVLAVGTVGFHFLEGYSYLDAFYFISMIATGQGPSQVPGTGTGKMFASVMAFVSVGTVVASLGFLFGPFFGFLWRIGHERWEEEIHSLKGDPKK
ncbi:MAG: two pore domain potassium channel family protein [Candidatus Omnitrophica bacterium]|nr:two pore domain potassium channel family protein [Candidatus Omnitrophota bacterium]